MLFFLRTEKKKALKPVLLVYHFTKVVLKSLHKILPEDPASLSVFQMCPTFWKIAVSPKLNCTCSLETVPTQPHSFSNLQKKTPPGTCATVPTQKYFSGTSPEVFLH